MTALDGPYLLGVDIGSYESKGVIATPTGRVAASAAVGHAMSFPRPGWAEHDAEEVWWGDFVQLCRQLLAQSGLEPRQIGAVGVSGMAQCVLPLDRRGRALRPAILYGVDMRAAAEAAELEALIGSEQVMARCGHRLLSQDLGPRVLWLKRHEPEVFAQTNVLLTTSSYLVYRLTGEKVIDVYTAYDSAPMFDIHRIAYAADLTLPFMPAELLPRPAWTCEVVGTVTQAAAAETGLAVGTPVIAGTADAAAEALSAGLSRVGDLMIMYGSSAFFILQTDRLVVSDTLWGDHFLQPGTFVVAAGMAVGGSLTRWFRDNFAQAEMAAEAAGGPNAYARLAELAAGSPPGANGLLMLPYASGERAPFYDPEARGLLAGLSLAHTRADVYRALLESVGYGIRQNVEAMVAAGLPPRRCLAVGGGTRNRLWLQIVSDILGVEQHVPDQNHGACYGDAFLAGIGIGLFKEIGEIASWIGYREAVQPDAEQGRRYADFYSLYRQLYQDTAEVTHRLVKLAG